MSKLAVPLLLAAAACGRIGYDEQRTGAGDDGPPPIIDTPSAACPDDMLATAASGKVCIEITMRGTASWLDSKASCMSLGRRLCTDAEWFVACETTTGLMNMAGGPATNWEWVADLVDSTTAKKRGFDFCSDESSHEISVDAYDYRCCSDL